VYGDGHHAIIPTRDQGMDSQKYSMPQPAHIRQMARFQALVKVFCQ
jgi:hypothetical protein